MPDAASLSPRPRRSWRVRLARLDRRRGLLTLLVAAVVAMSWLDVIDRATQNQVQSATTQALLAFAAARGLNAGISVLQSTEVGVGVSTHPFEALDPFNDLVEDYASVMKLAIGSLIGQTVLLEITATALFKIALSLAGLALVASLWTRSRATPWAWKAFALIGLGRFLLLLTLLASSLVDQAFLDQRTATNMAEVKGLAEEVQATSSTEAGSHLSPQERQRLDAEATRLDEQRQTVRESLVKANRGVAMAEDGVDQTRGRLGIMKARLSLAQRLNPFHEDPEIERLEAALVDKRRVLETRVSEREALLGRLGAIDRQRETLRRRLAGEDESLLESLGNRLASLTDSLSLAAIHSRIETGTSAILNLMALFVLRTLVIPLLFMWLGLKLFKGLYRSPVPRRLATPQGVAPTLPTRESPLP